jgi:hypothetical protein
MTKSDSLLGARIMAFSAARTIARRTTCVFFERKNEMNANQRSQENNQTDNGANEKWTAGSKGKTTDGPMDHTYPAGASQQQGNQAGGGAGTRQSDKPPGTQGGGQPGQQGSSQSAQRSGSMGKQQSRNSSDTQGGGQRGPQSGSMGGAQSTGRAGSQTGGSQQQAGPAVHESNDAAGGYPRSPGGANKLAADEKMDPDTGFSNTANRQQQVDEGSKQVEQSNVGRRDDMTPD